MRRRATSLLLCSLLFASSSCDRAPSTPAAARGSESSDRNAPPIAFEINVLAQLRPNLPTHLTSDRIGNSFWTQESDDLHDVLFETGAGTDAPQATRLSSGNILAALNANAPSKSSGGTIQSIAAGLDGKVYFYFSGGVGASILAALGRFDPRNGAIEILADTKTLAKQSGMGVSLSLARGKLLFSEYRANDKPAQHMRLWLRHSDASILLDFDGPRFSAEGDAAIAFTTVLSDPITMTDLKLDPPRTHADQEANERATSIHLTRDDLDLFSTAAPAGASSDTLLLVDKRYGRLLGVDVATGAAHLVASLVLLPDALGEPTLDPRGSVLLFVGESDDLINPQISRCPDPSSVNTKFPAFFVIPQDIKRPIIPIGPSVLRGPSGFAVHALRFKQITPIAADVYLAFDSTTGQMLKLTARGQ